MQQIRYERSYRKAYGITAAGETDSGEYVAEQQQKILYKFKGKGYHIFCKTVYKRGLIWHQKQRKKIIQDPGSSAM